MRFAQYLRSACQFAPAAGFVSGVKPAYASACSTLLKFANCGWGCSLLRSGEYGNHVAWGVSAALARPSRAQVHRCVVRIVRLLGLSTRSGMWARILEPVKTQRCSASTSRHGSVLAIPPVGQQGALEHYAFAAIDHDLAVVRKMISILCQQHVGQKSRAGTAAVDGAARRRAAALSSRRRHMRAWDTHNGACRN